MKRSQWESKSHPSTQGTRHYLQHNYISDLVLYKRQSYVLNVMTIFGASERVDIAEVQELINRNESIILVFVLSMRYLNSEAV